MKPVIALRSIVDQKEVQKLEAAGYIVVIVHTADDCQLIHPGHNDQPAATDRRSIFDQVFGR